MKFPQTYCKHCDYITESKETYWGNKCMKCDNYLPKDRFWNKVITLVVFLFIANFIFMSLASALPVDITPFSSNPLNGSTVNTRYVNLGWNITSVNPLDTILFNYNNTNYSLYDNSLVLYYNFDNRSSLGENGTFVVDISKNENNANLYNFPNATMSSAGKYNGGFGVTANNGSLRLNNLKINNSITNMITIMFWIRPTVATQQTIFTSTTANQNSIITLELYRTANKLKFALRNDTTSNLFLDNDSSVTVPKDSWTHVAVVYNSTTLIYYFNGIQDPSTFFNKNNISRNWTIAQLGSHPTAGRYMGGVLDDFMIFNRTLSNSEIINFYNSQLTKIDNTNYSFTANNSINGIDFNNNILFCNDTSNNYNTSSLSIRLLSNLFLSNYLIDILKIQYGTNTHGAYLSQKPSEPTNNNYLIYDSVYNNAKMTSNRIDTAYDVYQTSQTVYSTDRIGMLKNLTLFANQTNSKLLIVVQGMPTFLANTTIQEALCYSSNKTCPPIDYDAFANLTVDFLSKINCNPNICEIEIGNEINTQLFFLRNISENSSNTEIRMKYFNKIYNATYTAIKNNNSNYKVGGFGMLYNSGGIMAQNDIVLRSFFNNFSNQMQFFSFHRYLEDGDLNKTYYQVLSEIIPTIYANCTSYNGNCSNLYLDEGNYAGSLLFNSSNRINNNVAHGLTYITQRPKLNISFWNYEFSESKYQMFNITNMEYTN